MTSVVQSVTLVLLSLHALSVLVTCKRPNVMLIVLDDAGWGDFQSHDPLMVTPNIRRLREEGVFLNQSYVLPMCVPTRAALLTGRYPHTYGLQEGSAIGEYYLNENFTILPQELKALGYQTHMVGKWHMGDCHPGLYPTARGFDSFYGMLFGGHHSQYYHKNIGGVYDIIDDGKVDWSALGTYKTDVFHAKAMKKLQKIDYTKPFFFYMAHYAPHDPYEVPQAYRDKYCSHVTNKTRQIYCAMMARADDSIGQMLQLLKDKGVYNDTIVLCMSDNGGNAKEGSAVNWPLRGAKQTVYEGGTRSYTILKAPGLAATNVTWSGMIHAIDWLPTLVSAAGGKKPGYVHGKNLWNKLKNNKPSSRNKFIYTVNDFEKMKHSAFRYRKWKLIKGTAGAKKKCGWFPPFQLLQQGYPWGLNGTKVEEDFALYNIEKDPEERNNVYNDPSKAGVIRKMKRMIDRYLGVPGVSTGIYPLQPFSKHKLGKTKQTKDGSMATCRCRPAGLADSKACP